MRYLTTFFILAAWCAALPFAAQASFSISHAQVEEHVTNALQQLGVGDSVTATLQNPAANPLFTHHSSLSLQVENLDYNTHNNSWNAEVQFLSHGNMIRRFPISGSYETMTEAPVLLRDMRRGEIITQRDIAMERFHDKHVNGNTALSAEELIGLSPRRTLKAGRPVSLSQVEAPILIKRGAAIQMYYSTPFMEIKALGEALENGAKGDIIRARNTESGLTVRGVVVSENEIRISGGSSW